MVVTVGRGFKLGLEMAGQLSLWQCYAITENPCFHMASPADTVRGRKMIPSDQYAYGGWLWNEAQTRTFCPSRNQQEQTKSTTRRTRGNDDDVNRHLRS